MDVNSCFLTWILFSYISVNDWNKNLNSISDNHKQMVEDRTYFIYYSLLKSEIIFLK